MALSSPDRRYRVAVEAFHRYAQSENSPLEWRLQALAEEEDSKRLQDETDDSCREFSPFSKAVPVSVESSMCSDYSQQQLYEAMPPPPAPPMLQQEKVVQRASFPSSSTMTEHMDMSLKVPQNEESSNVIPPLGSFPGYVLPLRRESVTSLSSARRRTSIQFPLVQVRRPSVVTPAGPSLSSQRIQFAEQALIGKGSSGKVYRAMVRDTNQLIAVKEVPLARPGSPHYHFAGKALSSRAADAYRSSALAEMEMLKQLDHPNIIKFLGDEVDEDAGVLRIFMDLVSGGSVKSILTTFGPLQESQAATFTYQTLCGLEYLHSKSIVHRDVKGDNLLVDPSGTLKLADFGTATLTTAISRTREIGGTAQFMSPEVLTKEKEVTVKADIWSVGCCVIEMIRGRPPLDHLHGQYAVMMLIAKSSGELEKNYIPPESKTWSPALQDFLHNCLRRNPEERPSASELLRHPWITAHISAAMLIHPPGATPTAEAIGPLPLGGGVPPWRKGSSSSQLQTSTSTSKSECSGKSSSGSVLSDSSTLRRKRRARRMKRAKESRSRSERGYHPREGEVYSPLKREISSAANLLLPRLERDSLHNAEDGGPHHTDHVSARWTFPSVVPQAYR